MCFSPALPPTPALIGCGSTARLNKFSTNSVNSLNVFIFNIFSFYFHYSRTPGSRQPSPAEEAVSRPQTLLDPNAFHQQHFQHMLNASMDHHTHAGQMNSYHPQMMNHQMPGTVMNGVGGLQVQQVSQLPTPIATAQLHSNCVMKLTNKLYFLLQNPMVNQQQGQGHNSIDSSANILQQQHNFDVQVSHRQHSFI